MQLTLFRVFGISSWKIQLKGLSSRAKLLLLLLASVSLGMLAAGVVLRQRRRRYRAKSLSYMGVAMTRQNTFGGRSSISSNRSVASHHRRIDSFPEVYIIDEDGDDDTNDVLVADRSRVSVDMSIMEYDNLTVNKNEDLFLSLSQNMSTEVLSGSNYYDVTPELDSLITSYPSMVSQGVVAQDYLSISDSDESFESAIESLQCPSDKNKFYLSALILVEEGNIKCRIMRTTVLGCSSDRDFLAKLFCIRQAFNHLLLSEDHRQYAIDAGKDLILSLLKVSNSDPESFITRYNEILQFIQDQNNWTTAEQELKNRGVACLNIYDVALDFMLMDAFDDLSLPPSALLSVIQNGWISDGIKQSMLNTAVWSILKAKKSVLKNKNGFMSKFYLLSETMSPVFAWGFLGTDGVLKDRCLKFKNEMMSLIRSMFSLQDANYSNIQTLSDDIMRLTRQTVNSLSDD